MYKKKFFFLFWLATYWNLPPDEKVSRRKHPACKRATMDCTLMDNTHWKTPPYWTSKSPSPVHLPSPDAYHSSKILITLGVFISCRTVVLWFYILVFDHNATDQKLQFTAQIFCTLWGSISLLSSFVQSCILYSIILHIFYYQPVYLIQLYSSLQTSKLVCFKFSTIRSTWVSYGSKFKTSEHIDR
jgi:hypothetical protein